VPSTRHGGDVSRLRGLDSEVKAGGGALQIGQGRREQARATGRPGAVARKQPATEADQQGATGRVGASSGAASRRSSGGAEGLVPLRRSKWTRCREGWRKTRLGLGHEVSCWRKLKTQSPGSGQLCWASGDHVDLAGARSARPLGFGQDPSHRATTTPISVGWAEPPVAEQQHPGCQARRAQQRPQIATLARLPVARMTRLAPRAGVDGGDRQPQHSPQGMQVELAEVPGP